MVYNLKYCWHEKVKVILHKNETLLLLLCLYCCKQIDYFYSCILRFFFGGGDASDLVSGVRVYVNE